MYLNYLEEKEKVAFLKLAYALARTDGNFCANEKIVITSYCNEMGIDNVGIDLREISIDAISEEFNSSQSKRVVILELISILKADGEFHDSEKQFIDTLIKKFDIDNEFVENSFKWSNSMLNLIEQGADLIQS